MEFLLLLAGKSLIIAGGTLLLLKAMQRRSSSERSWVAHLGLLALLLLPGSAPNFVHLDDHADKSVPVIVSSGL